MDAQGHRPARVVVAAELRAALPTFGQRSLQITSVRQACVGGQQPDLWESPFLFLSRVSIAIE